MYSVWVFVCLLACLRVGVLNEDVGETLPFIVFLCQKRDLNNIY